MNTDLSTSQARIVVGVDGSPQSRQALQWSAHLGQMLGARLDAVTAWDYPAIYGRAAAVADWNPGQEMKKPSTTQSAPPSVTSPRWDCTARYARAAPPRSCSRQPKVPPRWSSAAGATEGSPGCCSARSARTSPGTPPAPS